jgi:hypothetical protein
MIQGKDFPQWHEPAAIAALTTAAARPARAEITLAAEREQGSVVVKASARVPSAADRKGAALYVALADDGLTSDVKAGENAGVRSRARQRRPCASSRSVAGRERRGALGGEVAAARGSRDASTVVAFVQNGAAGDVLQALALPLDGACAAAR